jgi:hypothetical protein
LTIPTRVSSLPSYGPTVESPSTEMVLFEFTTSKISQLGAAPIAGHSVNGAVTGFAADAVPAVIPSSVIAVAVPIQSARQLIRVPTLTS